MKKIKVGVVGTGYLGRFHAQKYAAMEDAELIAVADTDIAQAEKVAEEVKTKPYFTHKELIGKVDAVSIAVSTPGHFNVARDFLNSDIDVLIEKPITTSLEEADALIEIAESKNLILQVGHLERFNSAVMALEGKIHHPRFIESHRLSMFQPRGTDVSVVLDLMIHDIDIISNLVKSEIKTIHAAGISVITDHVDIANARLEFLNGAVANVTASRVSAKNQRKIRLFQKDGYISVDFANHEITIVQPEEKTDNSLIPGMGINQLCFTKGDALDDELKSFVQSVKHRKAPEVTGKMGRDALKIALTIMEQIQTTNSSLLEQV